MDIRMPNVDGLEATRQITAGGTATARVLILTTFDDDEYDYEAIRHGASGFLLKDAPAADLLSAIRVVAAGDAILAPTVTRRLIDRFARRKGSNADDAALATLSAREREVFVLMARGLSNTEIGHALVVSEATVKTHVSHLLAKLACRDRVQTVVTAYRSGVMDDAS
jgi:DNA-binding NarL/FixJ family response regulator